MRAWPIVAMLLMVAAPAWAQDTRAAAIATEQSQKAARLAPATSNWAEQLLLTLRKTLVENPSGIYPYFDSVYSGGGFTLGAGTRWYTGDRTNWSVAGLYSAKGYKLIDAGVMSPGHFAGRLDLHANALWRDATRVSYHGLGMDSPADANTAFRMQQTYAGGDVTARPHRWVLLTAAVSYEGYAMEDPTGGHTPVDAVFDETTAPAVGVSPEYLHTTGSVAFDSRPAADYARRGTLLAIARHHYADRDATYSFDRLDAEIVQHVPILRENWVISLHGRLETTLDEADRVPYFLLPSLGSGSTLRGYSSWRFRDRHALLLSGEWRWIPSRLALDMALFYDTGMVAPTLDDISTGGFASNYGIGARFHGPARTPLRVELARGREGTRLVFSASAAF